MEAFHSGDRHQQKRTTHACEACRRSKVKCSGLQPCEMCQRRLLECRFVEEGRKVTVSTRYLRNLQAKARQRPPDHVSRPITRAEETVTVDQCDSEEFDTDAEAEITNKITSPPQINPDEVAECRENGVCFDPFTAPAVVLKMPRKMKRKWVFLAPTSTWSFHLRLTAMIRNRLRSSSMPDIWFSLDGDAYRLAWNTSSYSRRPEISGIPPLSYAKYLCSTVKFHLNQIFLFFDEDAFDIHLQEFYQSASETAAQNRLWFVQFLLILAFGTAILNRAATSTSEPPGARFFLWGMSFMPDMFELWEDPSTSTEIFAMIALYLYSIDMRESASLYICQAVRIAISEGMHTELPANQIGLEECRRRNNLWWTVYILDQRITSSLGGPPSISDNYITAPQPSPVESRVRDAALNLQAKVSRLTCKILGAVYNARSGVGNTYLQRTAAVFRDLSTLSRELQSVVETKFKSSVNALSKDVLHVVLSYHHCVILAVRPLLICVLEERLKRLENPKGACRSVSKPFEALIRTCVDSASTTIHILTSLMQSNQLETFLPFDVDFTMSSGIALLAANFLFSDTIENTSYEEKVTRLLNEMASKGSRLAVLRRGDLERLKADFEAVTKEEGMQNKPDAPAAYSAPTNGTATEPRIVLGESMHSGEIDSDQQPWLPTFDSGLYHDPCFAPSGYSLFHSGLSPNTMSSIAQQLSQSGMSMMNGSDCLWETDMSTI